MENDRHDVHTHGEKLERNSTHCNNSTQVKCPQNGWQEVENCMKKQGREFQPWKYVNGSGHTCIIHEHMTIELVMSSRFGVVGFWRMFNCSTDAACALHFLFLINMHSYLLSISKSFGHMQTSQLFHKCIRVQFLGKFWLGMTLHAHTRLLWCATFAHYTSANSDSTELYKSIYCLSVNKRKGDAVPTIQVLSVSSLASESTSGQCWPYLYSAQWRILECFDGMTIRYWCTTT